MGTIGAPNIVTDKLVMTIDAASPNSYPGSGTTIYNTAPYLDNDGYGQQRLALTADIDGASFNSGTQPSWVFDGTNDFINFGKATQGKCIVPFASSHIYLHPKTKKYNDSIQSHYK